MSYGCFIAGALGARHLLRVMRTPPAPAPAARAPGPRPVDYMLSEPELSRRFDAEVDRELDALRRHFGGDDGCDLRRLQLSAPQLSAVMVLALADPHVASLRMHNPRDNIALNEIVGRVRAGVVSAASRRPGPDCDA